MYFIHGRCIYHDGNDFSDSVEIFSLISTQIFSSNC